MFKGCGASSDALEFLLHKWEPSKIPEVQMNNTVLLSFDAFVASYRLLLSGGVVL